jgi:hypothetical protein
MINKDFANTINYIIFGQQSANSIYNYYYIGICSEKIENGIINSEIFPQDGKRIRIPNSADYFHVEYDNSLGCSVVKNVNAITFNLNKSTDTKINSIFVATSQDTKDAILWKNLSQTKTVSSGNKFVILANALEFILGGQASSGTSGGELIVDDNGYLRSSLFSVTDSGELVL